MFPRKFKKNLVLSVIIILLLSSILISIPVQSEETIETVSEKSLESKTSRLFSSFSEIHSSMNQERLQKTSSPIAENAKRIAEVEFDESLYDNISSKEIIAIDIFENRYEVIVEDVSNNIGVRSGRGLVRGSDFGFFTFSKNNEIWSFTLELPEEQVQYAVRHTECDGHYLYENSLTDIQEKRSKTINPGDLYLNHEHELTTTPQSTNDTNIDVMVVYTPQAREWASDNEGNINNVISSAQQRANMVVSNSKIDLDFNTVHTAEVDYQESGNSSTDLMRLTNTSDGYMEDVHKWRDHYGADLVSLLAKVDDVGGIAWQLDDPDGIPEIGFSLTNVQQASTTYTYIHEIGHNMGAHHHKEQDIQPGPGLYSYSAGWRWSGGRPMGDYVSVMTYRDPLDETYPIFSNPNVEHMGDPAGCPMDGDNARTLRETKNTIANYRESQSFPYFKIRNLDVDDTVEGEMIDVYSVIENTGDISGTQEVEMKSVIGSDGESISLEPGETETVTFNVDTSEGDSGRYTIEVLTDDFSKTESVRILELAFYDVSISSINESIIEGDILDVFVDIENMGDVSGEQIVEMSSGLGDDNESVSLSSGENKIIKLSIETYSGDAGEHDVKVSSEDDFETRSVEILEPAYFDVTLSDINQTVIEGELLELNVDIDNTGDVEGNQSIDLFYDSYGDGVADTLVDNEDVNLDGGGAAKNISLKWDTEVGDAGEILLNVTSEDDYESFHIDVLKPAYFEIDIVRVESGIIEGDEVTVEYFVNNTGDVKGEQDIELYIDGELLEQDKNVIVEGGEIYEGEFTWTAEDEGEFDLEIKSIDEVETVNILVEKGFLASYWWIIILIAAGVFTIGLISKKD